MKIEDTLKTILGQLVKNSNSDLSELVKDLDVKEGNLEYLFHQIEQFKKGLLMKFLTTHKAIHLLQNRDFYEGHIVALIKQVEGNACSYDKSSFIIESLIRFYEKGTEINLDPNAEYKFMYPREVLTTHSSIVDFMEALTGLFYGDIKPYMEYILKYELNK